MLVLQVFLGSHSVIVVYWSIAMSETWAHATGRPSSLSATSDDSEVMILVLDHSYLESITWVMFFKGTLTLTSGRFGWNLPISNMIWWKCFTNEREVQLHSPFWRDIPSNMLTWHPQEHKISLVAVTSDIYNLFIHHLFCSTCSTLLGIITHSFNQTKYLIRHCFETLTSHILFGFYLL